MEGAERKLSEKFIEDKSFNHYQGNDWPDNYYPALDLEDVRTLIEIVKLESLIDLLEETDMFDNPLNQVKQQLQDLALKLNL